MGVSRDEICRRIAEVGPSLHSAGTFPARTLEAIARAAGKRNVQHSAETGSGASTLLFSHLSEHHTVFALDAGSGSITNVRRSPLLRPNIVTFVEGPTQPGTESLATPAMISKSRLSLWGSRRTNCGLACVLRFSCRLPISYSEQHIEL